MYELALGAHYGLIGGAAVVSFAAVVLLVCGLITALSKLVELIAPEGEDEEETDDSKEDE